jgi:Zn-finger nucleic acid-binding protein
MPLLVSPIDGQTPMQQIIRNGIEIDRCPVSGGVWLDKGELEKLLGAVQEAALEDR